MRKTGTPEDVVLTDQGEEWNLSFQDKVDD